MAIVLTVTPSPTTPAFVASINLPKAAIPTDAVKIKIRTGSNLKINFFRASINWNSVWRAFLLDPAGRPGASGISFRHLIRFQNRGEFLHPGAQGGHIFGIPVGQFVILLQRIPSRLERGCFKKMTACQWNFHVDMGWLRGQLFIFPAAPPGRICCGCKTSCRQCPLQVRPAAAKSDCAVA